MTTQHKPVIYQELDSVGNDFLQIQDALLNGETDVNLLAFSCQYNGYLVEYDMDGQVYITKLDHTGKMPTDSLYWDGRTTVVDCTACNSEDDLYCLWNEEVKPILKR